MSTDASQRNELLEQYKLLVQSAEKISERRSAANNYLLAVNAALLSLHALGSKIQPEVDWSATVPLAGIVVCISWFSLIRSYRNVNAAKFEVIHDLESQLPVQPYKDEWERMKSTHLPLSVVEQWIPALVGLIYLALLILARCAS